LWTQSASIFTSNTKQSFERRKHDLIWLDDDAVVEERFEDGGEF
jgi:hypothetical protein